MKGKRMVELEAYQEIDEDTYEDLYNHARNSGIWYATNLPKTTKELKRKLYEKGYPKEHITVLYDNGSREEINIVDKAVASLVDAMFVDDLIIAERYAESKKNARYGRSKVQRDLAFRGIDPEDLEEILDQVYGTEEDVPAELRELVEKTFRLEAPRIEDDWKLRRKLIQKAVSRGWDFSDVQVAIDEVMEQRD